MQPATHLLELPQVEDISPLSPSHLALVLASEENASVNAQVVDLFEGSSLSGYGLPPVGSVFLGHCLGEVPGEHEVTLWSLVRTGGGDCPECIPQGWVE